MTRELRPRVVLSQPDQGMFVLSMAQSWEPGDLGFFQKGEWQDKVRIKGDWECAWDTVPRVKVDQICSLSKSKWMIETHTPQHVPCPEKGQSLDRRKDKETSQGQVAWERLEESQSLSVFGAGSWHGDEPLYALGLNNCCPTRPPHLVSLLLKGKEDFWLGPTNMTRQLITEQCPKFLTMKSSGKLRKKGFFW